MHEKNIAVSAPAQARMRVVVSLVGNNDDFGIAISIIAEEAMVLAIAGIAMPMGLIWKLLQPCAVINLRYDVLSVVLTGAPTTLSTWEPRVSVGTPIF